MGLFDFLFGDNHENKPRDDKEKQTYSKDNRLKKLQKKYYADYPEIPYMSADRLGTDWEERMALFPNMIVQPDMMERTEEGLLPGHIYQLYWIDQYNPKRIPVYFEYQYGIDFEKGKVLLESEGYLQGDKATAEGKLLIRKHKKVIDKHKGIPNSGKLQDHQDVHPSKSSIKLAQSNPEFTSNGDFLDDQRMGNSYEKNKDYDNAIKAYKSAIVNSKKENGEPPPNPYKRLAVIYRKLNDKKSEISILEESLHEVSKETTSYKKLEERLAKLKK